MQEDGENKQGGGNKDESDTALNVLCFIVLTSE